MKFKESERLRSWLAPPHPTWQSKESRTRVHRFIKDEAKKVENSRCLNVGSANRRYSSKTINIDIRLQKEVDIQGDLVNLPIKTESVESVVCTGVLEHTINPYKAVEEIYRVLKSKGRLFVETPFMQTVHAAPQDYARWTPDGLRQLLKVFKVIEFKVVAGPASALAWQFQETLAMLFCFNSEKLYKINLRLFGWLAIPLSWLDIILEKNPMAWKAASGYAVLAEKS
jgi:SAM-dependent methyltransferase